MTDRYEAIAVRKYEQNGEQKTAFTNIGVAFKMKERDGYSLRLHCLPAPVDGEYTVLLMPPKPREDSQTYDRAQERRPAARKPSAASVDDDIPF